jgi:hypothetical protein
VERAAAVPKAASSKTDFSSPNRGSRIQVGGKWVLHAPRGPLESMCGRRLANPLPKDRCLIDVIDCNPANCGQQLKRVPVDGNH